MTMAESNLTRRDFVAAIVAIPMFGTVRRTAPSLEEVVIVDFNDAGVRQGTVHVPKVVKSDAEWRSQLSPISYQITRQHGTERAFTGPYWNLHDRGIFRCVCCGTALFASAVNSIPARAGRASGSRSPRRTFITARRATATPKAKSLAGAATRTSVISSTTGRNRRGSDIASTPWHCAS